MLPWRQSKGDDPWCCKQADPTSNNRTKEYTGRCFGCSWQASGLMHCSRTVYQDKLVTHLTMYSLHETMVSLACLQHVALCGKYVCIDRCLSAQRLVSHHSIVVLIIKVYGIQDYQGVVGEGGHVSSKQLVQCARTPSEQARCLKIHRPSSSLLVAQLRP
jgi:hypothetical protein